MNKTIEELRKQLAEAEAEAAELNKEISSYNQSIENVKSKYSRQLGRLEKKSKSVKESRADWTAEKESIEKAKAAHEAVVAAHSEEMVTREKLIEDIKSESATATSLEEIVASAFSDSDAAADREAVDGKEGDDDCTAVYGEVLKYEAVVNEAKQNVAAAETNIENLREELSTIDVRVPILEAEKKNAASRRDFKAAGKASKEIKDALARKEQCEAELAGEAMERKQFATDELEKVTALLDEKKKVAAERGREAGMKQMERLREKITELKSMMKKFAGSTDGSKEGEEEDDAMNVSIVGAFVIESQICVLEAEGKALGDKYGGWEEAVLSADVVEESSVQSAPTFDSAEDSAEITVDEGVLTRYMLLRSKMKDIEKSIEEAAEKEEYERAAELEEQAQIVRDEFDSAGFSSEKFEEAVKNFMANSSPANATIDEEVLEKYSSLCADIKDLEEEIEKAAADEDYERAADLEEKMQSVRSEINELGFSEQELEEALKSRGEEPATSEQHDVVEDSCTEVEEENGGTNNETEEGDEKTAHENGSKTDVDEADEDGEVMTNTEPEETVE